VNGPFGMRLTDFRRSLAQETPPSGLGDCLEALWWAGKRDWERAHAIAQELEGPNAAWVHAYLHRVDGDLQNARYWYVRAKRVMPASPLEQEWAEIAESLLQDRPDP